MPVELDMPATEPLMRRFEQRDMVSWLHPVQVLRTGFYAALATRVTAHLDRREMLAALPRPGRDRSTATPLVPGEPDLDLDRRAADGTAWVDFVADLGDGWDATYATAYMLGRDRLAVRGLDRDGEDWLPRAGTLVFGGDEVYPMPSRDAYRTRTVAPYTAAFPGPADGTEPALFAIPGNHDWYDGLTNFVRTFCQGGRIGGWHCHQARSYFAVRLPRDWWILGIDIALETRIDAPQLHYFRQIAARHFDAGTNVILCTAKPAWLPPRRHGDDAMSNLKYFDDTVVREYGGRVRAYLAGDNHHYARYYSADGVQRITCGGGGAYIIGTHRLPRKVDVPERRSETVDETADAGGGRARDGGATGRDVLSRYVESGYPFPGRDASVRLSRKALGLPFIWRNLPFTATVGLAYAIFAAALGIGGRDGPIEWAARSADGFGDLVVGVGATALGELQHHPLAALIAIVALLLAGAFPAIWEGNARKWATWSWGVLYGVVQLAGPVAVALSISWGVHDAAGWDGRAARAAVFLATAVVGGVVGGVGFGAYFLLSDRLFHWHTNETFASLSSPDYRSFLRMRIDDEGLTIFPIGLRRVPHRWRPDPRHGPEGPLFLPDDRAVEPELIEGPIRIPR